MRDRIAHADGRGRIFARGSGYCLIEAGGHGGRTAGWAS
jgi:hypothetical protein